MCDSCRRHQKPFSLCILITCSSNAGSIDFCSNNLCVCASVSLCVFQHAPTNKNQYRVNAPETSVKCFFFFHFGNATSIFQSFPKQTHTKIKSLYNKQQQQLLNACLTELNPTPKKEPPPPEKNQTKTNTQQFLNSHYFCPTTVCTSAGTGRRGVSSSTTKRYKGTEEEEEEEKLWGFFKGS